MSEFKIIDGDDTAEFQLEAAQSELAALREELARKSVVIEDMVESNCDMGQFLAAAEQRNAELDLEWSRTITDRGLIKIELDKAKRLLERSATAMSAIRNNPSLVRDIDDFLKPTESGASE